MDFLAEIHPVLQALMATAFTWGMTAIGAGFVFLTNRVDRRLLDGMLGFSLAMLLEVAFS
ncbi:MAG: hypothetical protein ACK2T2_04680 [Anaerolineales bacterium]|jgi:ZIP family zinc transporter